MKLQEELDDRFGDSKTPISFSDAQKLPYLNAVIDESMRCHWISRIPQPRDTLKDGLHICGHWVPAGVAVSTYGTVLHHRKEVFGEDVYVFRPERWLGEKDRVQRMRNTLFSFGSGKYSCLGRHLAMLMILKFVPSVLREFDVSPLGYWTFIRNSADLRTVLTCRTEQRVDTGQRSFRCSDPPECENATTYLETQVPAACSGKLANFQQNYLLGCIYLP